VFVGHYTPETLGDYCSGTNHVLPTAGWARSHGSLSTADFMLRMTVQHASAAGLANIGPDAALLAEHEQLHAHAEAVRLRLRSSP
jgi:histidinol dehydrogenase